MIKIKVLGLITEYNPFHNGHKYHLEESKKATGCDYSVAIMSGNFLQRGEPALINKWTRARMAVASGVDLVIELPCLYASNSAEYFAFGSTYILNSTGLIDSICFGSESGEINWLSKVANLLAYESEEFKSSLNRYLDLGNNYPKSRELAIAECLSLDYNISAPNNILGLEYIKNLIQLNSNIQVATIKRIKAEYNSININSNICSATAIRHILKSSNNLNELKNVVPTTTMNILQDGISDSYAPIFTEDFSQMLLYKIRSSSTDYIKTIHDVREGLEHRILRASLESTDYVQLLDLIKTKRYTETSIKRILIKILLDITQDMAGTGDNKVPPSYIRVLDFNKKGAAIIKKMKKTSSLPIITNLKKYTPQNPIAAGQLNLDIKATNIYNLALSKSSLRKAGEDFRITPRIYQP